MINRILSQTSDRFKRSFGALHDCIMAGLSFLFANYAVAAVTDGPLTPGLYEKTTLFTALSAAVFYIFELNRGSWRYASIPDLLAILKSVTLAVLVYVLVIFSYSRGEGFSRLVPVLLWFVLILALAGPRISYRMVRERGWVGLLREGNKVGPDAKFILVYKANEISDAYVRAVKARPDSKIHIAGIIDDDARKGTRTIQGLKVLGEVKNIAKIVTQLEKNYGVRVEELAIADHSFDKKALSELVTLAGDCGLVVSLIPDIVKTTDANRTESLDPQPLLLSDLLGRPEINYNLIEVTRFIDGKTVLLTGAGGSIGSELARQIVTFNPRRLIIVDMSEHFLYTIDMELREKFPNLEIISRIADIRDEKRVENIFVKYRPDVVFHAAAIKHVPLAEQNISETIKTNVLGTRNCALAAIKCKAAVFVMISTDKAVNPTNVMGATKRAAESYCQALDLQDHGTRFKTVRFGNVLGSNGSVVPRFAAQIARGGPVTVTHQNIVRYFMTIPEAVRLVLQVSSMGLTTAEERGKILVLDMGEPVRIADLAERMIRLAGFKPNVDIMVEYVGLRPGEKLFEELFDEREVQNAAYHENYIVASPKVVDFSTLDTIINEMALALKGANSQAALAKLRLAVPEYEDMNQNVVEENIPSGVANAAAPRVLSIVK
jgi:FlaA1/EpsC-like NDP-sugar epimerase